MPTHPLRRYCTVQSCPNRTNGGPCPEHAVQREHARSNYTWRRHYRQAPWRRLRLAVLAAEPWCSDCSSQGYITASTEVHHRQRPENEQQFFDRANLAALCRRCHAKRTGRGE